MATTDYKEGRRDERCETIDWLIDQVERAAERSSISEWHEGYEAGMREALRAVRLGRHTKTGRCMR